MDERLLPRYKALFTNSKSGVAVLQPTDGGNDFVFIDINPAGEKIAGLSRANMIGKTVCDLFPAVKEFGILHALREVSETGNPKQYPLDSYQDARIKLIVETYIYKEPWGDIVTIFDDLTKSRTLQAELERSKVELTLQNMIFNSFLTTSGRETYELVLLLVLKALQSDFGFFTYTDGNKETVCPAMYDKDRQCNLAPEMEAHFRKERRQEIWHRVQEQQVNVLHNESVRLFDGTFVLQNLLSCPILHNDRCIGVICVGNKNQGFGKKDLTLLENICNFIAPVLKGRLELLRLEERRNAANHELIRSEASLREAERMAKLGHWRIDHSSGELTWSDQVYQIFGVEKENFGGDVSAFLDLVHPKDRDLVLRSFEKSLLSKEPYTSIHRIILQDGTVKYLHEQCETNFGPNGEPLQSLGTVQDITERIGAEEKNRRLAAAVEESLDAIIITGADRSIEYVNSSFEQMTGYNHQEIIGQTPLFFKPDGPDDAMYREMQMAIANGESWKGRLTVRRKNGESITTDISIAPIQNHTGITVNFVMALHDVTRELALEQQLRQAVKLEAVGTLAGGIAHDFNNILGALIGYTRMAMDGISPKTMPYKDLEHVLEAGDRATELVKQILMFSRRQDSGFLPLQLSFLIKETEKMLRVSLPAKIHLALQIDRACPQVLADPTQIHQVLVNLSLNAAQAMRAKGGTLTISLQRAESEATVGEQATQEKNEYVALQVNDTGEGIAPEDLDKIFDPFYTTKIKGESSGLGLSVVHGIVSNHKGKILVDSEKEKGTTFTILIPAAPQTEKQEPQMAEKSPQGGGEHILLVDDEEKIRQLQERILKGLGYEVSSFAGSPETLQAFEREPQKYDILVTDFSMPEMDGMELAARIQAIRNIPVIVSTGYHESMEEKIRNGPAVAALLHKPVKMELLAKTVKKVLEDGKNPGS